MGGQSLWEAKPCASPTPVGGQSLWEAKPFADPSKLLIHP